MEKELKKTAAKKEDIKKLVIDKTELAIVKSEEVYARALKKYQKELTKWRLKIEIAKHQ